MIYTFSYIITQFFNLLMVPFFGNRGVALAVISLLAGVVMIFLFKATSNQDKIKASRDLFKARILEMRLYQDDLLLIFKALGGALWSNVVYLRVSLPAIVVLLSFVVFVFIQLDQRFGVAPLSPGESTLLSVKLKDGADPMVVPMTLETDAGLSVDAKPVRVPSRGEIHWRLRNVSQGEHTITLTGYDKRYSFDVVAEANTDVIGRERVANSMTDALIHLGLPKLPLDAPFESVHLNYPSTDYSFFGWRTHWIVIFIIWSFIGAAIPKFLFGIEV